MDDATTEGGPLIGIELMTSQLSASHTTNCVDEVMTVKIFKSILIRVVCVGMAVEVHRRWICNPILVMSVLGMIQYMCNDELRRTYSVLLFVEHKRGNGPTGIGTSTSLTTDTDCGTASAILILGIWDRAGGHWHDDRCDESGK